MITLQDVERAVDVLNRYLKQESTSKKYEIFYQTKFYKNCAQRVRWTICVYLGKNRDEITLEDLLSVDPNLYYAKTNNVGRKAMERFTRLQEDIREYIYQTD